MDQETQQTYRAEAIAKWEGEAWSKLCQTSFIGKRMEPIMQERNQAVSLAESLEQEANDIERDENATDEQKERVPNLRATAKGSLERVAEFDAAMEKDKELVTNTRKEAIRLINLATFARDWSYVPPVDSDNAPPVDATQAQAAGQEDGVPKIDA